MGRLRVEEAGDLPYGLDDGDGLPGVLLRGDREGVREAARHLFEQVVVVPEDVWAKSVAAQLAMGRVREALGLPIGVTVDDIVAAAARAAEDAR